MALLLAEKLTNAVSTAAAPPTISHENLASANIPGVSTDMFVAVLSTTYDFVVG